MRNSIVFAFHFLLSKIRSRNTTNDRIRGYLKNRKVIGNTRVMSTRQANIYIKRLIDSKEPFFVGRFGSTELFALRTFDFQVRPQYKKSLAQMQMCAGFFSANEKMGEKFKDLMLESIPEADVMGIWMLPFEKYYLNKYGSKKLKTTYLLDFEPWSCAAESWSAALKGKKVLVIHPFAETIESQYQKREKIFANTDILPEFELKTLKAIQTMGGERDDRFHTWFEALEFMHQEAMKIDFDIAIVGCGAYGFPLAAKLKKSGKQVIHLAGATQLLFGIKGKRWEENEVFRYIQKYFNDSWINPREEDRPKHANRVEGGCYW